MRHGAASQLSLPVLLAWRVAGRGPSYDRSGHVLLDSLLGARVEVLQVGVDAEELRAQGAHPFLIAPGGSMSAVHWTIPTKPRAPGRS